MCVDMGKDDRGEFVRLIDRDDPRRNTEYHFTHCFWSHDETRGDYADQQIIFDKIGKPLLRKVLDGMTAIE